MPERTSYAFGTPSWVDLSTSDIDAGRSFYADLFGWGTDVQDMGEQGTYTVFQKGDKTVAGGMAQMPQEAEMGVPPHWNTYINVENVDATIAKATDVGGTVVVEPMDVPDAGRMAFIQDPTGAVLGIWQSGEAKGAELVNEHGTLTWNELLSDDTAAARKFYGDLFGWGYEAQDTPNGPYTTFSVGGNPAGGIMAKPEGMGEMPSVWGVYFAVDDCDAALEKAKSLGGNPLFEPMDIPEVGRLVGIADPQGAMFSVITLINPSD